MCSHNILSSLCISGTVELQKLSIKWAARLSPCCGQSTLVLCRPPPPPASQWRWVKQIHSSGLFVVGHLVFSGRVVRTSCDLILLSWAWGRGCPLHYTRKFFHYHHHLAQHSDVLLTLSLNQQCGWWGIKEGRGKSISTTRFNRTKLNGEILVSGEEFCIAALYSNFVPW